MKENEIKAIVKAGFKNINKLYPAILLEYGMQNIHEFRIEIKSLRAFLRLAAVKSGFDDHIIPHKLKTFYGYAGIIRNIQLQIQLQLPVESLTGLPAGYLQILEADLQHWKSELFKLMEGNNFLNEEEKILEKLPKKLTTVSIKKFIKLKIELLKQIITHAFHDESMHAIRKQLKDLLYTWPYIKHFFELPEPLNTKESIKSVTMALGNFNDLCMQIAMLTTNYSVHILQTAERDILQRQATILEKQKQELKTELTEMLVRINLR